MTDGTGHTLLSTGRAALARGDIDAAIAALGAAADTDEVPEAHELLGGLAYATEDMAAVRRHWEAAFRGYRDAGNLRGAGRCATNLGHFHFSVLGHEAVAAGWLGRARRLLDQVGRCVELGYLELAVISCDVRDALALERSAVIALKLAEEFDDPDLHARALADGGLALVSQGRITEGFAWLDEAMVPVSMGELHNPVTPAMVFCAMLSACDRARDLRRAEEWTQLCTELLLEHLDGRMPVLHSHCRIVYGAVLCTVGRWPEAEEELLRAVRGTKVVSRRAMATARLAELRLLQGRLADAAELLAPIEDQFEAAETLARLHLATSRLDLAASVIDRHLDELAADRLRSGRLLAYWSTSNWPRQSRRSPRGVAPVGGLRRGRAMPGPAGRDRAGPGPGDGGSRPARQGRHPPQRRTGPHRPGRTADPCRHYPLGTRQVAHLQRPTGRGQRSPGCPGPVRTPGRRS